MRTIIRLIEADARSVENANFRVDYRPTGLNEALNPLIEGYRRRRKRSEEEESRQARRRALLADEVYTIAVPEEEEGDLRSTTALLLLSQSLILPPLELARPARSPSR